MRPGRPRKDTRLPGVPKDVDLRTFPGVICLRCRNPFNSRDPMLNRVCNNCSDVNAGLSRRDVARPTCVPKGLEPLIDSN